MQAPDFPCRGQTDCRLKASENASGTRPGRLLADKCFRGHITPHRHMALDIGNADGFELYAVAGLMAAAGVGVWLFGRAVYRLAQ